MKIQLVAVGGKMPSWVKAGYDEYAKRLPKDLVPKLTEITIGHRSKTGLKKGPAHQAMKAEGEAILNAIPKQTKKIMLDLAGKPWSTEQLAEQLSNWRMQGDDIAFVIGGPDGLSPECIAKADAKWCLSNLTLPHPLVRIVFIEQIYRAWTVLQNHPYHK